MPYDLSFPSAWSFTARRELSAFVSFCASAYVSVPGSVIQAVSLYLLCVCLSVCLSVYLSVSRGFWARARLCVCASVSVCGRAFGSVCLLIFYSVCRSFCQLCLCDHSNKFHADTPDSGWMNAALFFLMSDARRRWRSATRRYKQGRPDVQAPSLPVYTWACAMYVYIPG